MPSMWVELSTCMQMKKLVAQSWGYGPGLRMGRAGLPKIGPWAISSFFSPAHDGLGLGLVIRRTPGDEVVAHGLISLLISHFFSTSVLDTELSSCLIIVSEVSTFTPVIFSSFSLSSVNFEQEIATWIRADLCSVIYYKDIPLQENERKLLQENAGKSNSLGPYFGQNQKE